MAVYRLHEARRGPGLEERVAFDHRAFPLELEAVLQRVAGA